MSKVASLAVFAEPGSGPGPAEPGLDLAPHPALFLHLVVEEASIPIRTGPNRVKGRARLRLVLEGIQSRTTFEFD